jgi:type VI secretion system protein ImpJ
MQITPHHFQQNDARIDQQITGHIGIISNHHWGVSELLIDPVALVHGRFSIEKTKIVMPDGHIYDYAEKERKRLPLVVELEATKKEELGVPVTLTLVLTKRLDGSSPLTGTHPRLISIEGEEIQDENTGENPCKIPRLFPNFRLQIGEKVNSNDTGFPIAKVIYEEGVFKRAPFTPPCFQIEETSHLWARCLQITALIREKVLIFSERWQNQVGTALMRETADILRPLVAMLPTLEALVNSKAVHPFDLYNELMEAAGLVAQLNLSTAPPRFERYNHNDIDSCVLPVMDYIQQTVENISLEYTILPFKKNDRVFSFKLRHAYLPETPPVLYVGLRSKPGIHARQIEIWMKEAVIVSDEALEKVQSQRMTGAPRSLITGDKLYEMSPPKDITLFSVTKDPHFIQPEQYLHIFNPSDRENERPEDIVLFVSKDEEGPKVSKRAVSAA